MTTIPEIHEALDDLNVLLSDKGWVNPRCEFNYDGSIWLQVKAAHPVEGGDSVYKFCGGSNASFDEALTEAKEKIHSLPSSEDAAKDDFRKALGQLIDKGNSLGIDADFLNPLVEQMRSLSENAITGPAA